MISQTELIFIGLSPFGSLYCLSFKESILREVLFYLLYTNDLSSNIKFTIVAYADDSSITAHGQNMEQLQHNLQL